MKKLIPLFFLPVAAFAQLNMVAALPDTCVIGQVFVLTTAATAGQNFYICTSANVLTNAGVAAGNVSGLGTAATQASSAFDASGAAAAAQSAAVSTAETFSANAANVTGGTLPAARLPAPTASTLGGIQSATPVTGQIVDGISTAGVPHQRALVSADIPNNAASTTGSAGSISGALGALSLASSNNYLANTGALTNVVECSTTNCPAGSYLVMVTIVPVTPASLGAISLTLNFTDPAQAQAITAISSAAFTSKVPSTAIYPFRSTGSTSVTWSTSLSGITGSYSYNVYVRILNLGA